MSNLDNFLVILFFQLQPTPRDSSPTTTDPPFRESISIRFSVVFESILLRKLEKAVAVSGVCSGVPEENSRKVPENCWKFFRIAKCNKFSDFGHRERQTCRETWVDTAGTLSHLPCGVFFEIDSSSLLEFF